MSDSDSAMDCPLCMEPFELDDMSFFPCHCGYQVCRFCWHRIKQDNSLCPACRQPYSDDPFKYKPLTEDDLHNLKQKKKEKELQRRKKITDNRKHLGLIRVLQKNLVFVVGLPQYLDEIEKLRSSEYFGQYGKVIKVVVNNNTSYAGTQGPSLSAYVTYSKIEEALLAVQGVNNVQIEGRTLKASLGTTKYCSTYLKNQQCHKTDCMYLHELADSEASFTKEDMQAGKHQEYERKLMKQMVKKQEESHASELAAAKLETRCSSAPTVKGGSSSKKDDGDSASDQALSVGGGDHNSTRNNSGGEEDDDDSNQPVSPFVDDYNIKRPPAPRNGKETQQTNPPEPPPPVDDTTTTQRSQSTSPHIQQQQHINFEPSVSLPTQNVTNSSASFADAPADHSNPLLQDSSHHQQQQMLATFQSHPFEQENQGLHYTDKMPVGSETFHRNHHHPLGLVKAPSQLQTGPINDIRYQEQFASSPFSNIAPRELLPKDTLFESFGGRSQGVPFSLPRTSPSTVEPPNHVREDPSALFSQSIWPQHTDFIGAATDRSGAKTFEPLKGWPTRLEDEATTKPSASSFFGDQLQQKPMNAASSTTAAAGTKTTTTAVKEDDLDFDVFAECEKEFADLTGAAPAPQSPPPSSSSSSSFWQASVPSVGLGFARSPMHPSHAGLPQHQQQQFAFCDPRAHAAAGFGDMAKNGSDPFASPFSTIFRNSQQQQQIQQHPGHHNPHHQDLLATHTSGNDSLDDFTRSHFHDSSENRDRLQKLLPNVKVKFAESPQPALIHHLNHLNQLHRTNVENMLQNMPKSRFAGYMTQPTLLTTNNNTTTGSSKPDDMMSYDWNSSQTPFSPLHLHMSNMSLDRSGSNGGGGAMPFHHQQSPFKMHQETTNSNTNTNFPQPVGPPPGLIGSSALQSTSPYDPAIIASGPPDGAVARQQQQEYQDEPHWMKSLHSLTDTDGASSPPPPPPQPPMRTMISAESNMNSNNNLLQRGGFVDDWSSKMPAIDHSYSSSQQKNPPPGFC